MADSSAPLVLTIVAIGAGAWWWYNREATAGGEAAPEGPATRNQVIERTPAEARDNPDNVTEDVQAWARRGFLPSAGRGNLLNVVRPRRFAFDAVLRSGSSIEVYGPTGSKVSLKPKRDLVGAVVARCDWRTSERSTRAYPQPNPDSASQGTSALDGGAWPYNGPTKSGGINPGDKMGMTHLAYGLPASPFVIRYSGAKNRERIPDLEPGVEFLPGTQGQVILDATEQTTIAIPAFVARGAAWIRVEDSRNFYMFRDAFDRQAGGNIGIEYFVSHIGRCAVYTGIYNGLRRSSAPRDFFTLPESDWSPVMGESQGIGRKMLRPYHVWPRSDFWSAPGAPFGNPARSPWCGTAMQAFLDLPVVEIPGLAIKSLATLPSIGRARDFKGRSWTNAAAVSYRFRMRSGRNYAQKRNSGGWPNGTFAYPGLAPELGA